MIRYFTYVLLFTLVVFSFPAFAYKDPYNGLLNDYVSPTSANNIQYAGVDYEAWKKDERHKKAVKSLLSINPETFKTPEEKLAFWLNAYNLLTIDLILSTNEQENIKNQGAPLKTPWNTHKWRVHDTEYTLDQIAAKITQPHDDPRVYFAMTAAAKSSPDLRQEAYTHDMLDAQLHDQVIEMFKNPTKGLKFEDEKLVRVSKIMDGSHKTAFAGGDLLKWLDFYFPEKIKPDTQIGFYNFDWSLNKKVK